MQLENKIRSALAKKNILLMTHLVLGYPSLATNREVIRQMVENGVDLIEMQLPFSEPMADGPMIVKANQEAIAKGIRISECLEFAGEITAAYDIPFLFMTYYNILYKYGVEQFCERARQLGVTGFIIPDLPPEEGKEYLKLTKDYGIAPVQIFAPTSTPERMQEMTKVAGGLIYCVARKGVTGVRTRFSGEITEYLDRCRRATDLPLAVGFGISDKQDVDFLTGKADIAVIGTQTIRIVDEKGPEAVGPFIAGLR